MLVFAKVFWYTKEFFGIIISICLLKSSKFHSNPTKFYVLIACGLTIPTPLVVNKFTISSTFTFTLSYA